MDKDRAENIYAPEAITARLGAELTDWAYRDGCLCRTYTATGWKATLMLVNTIGHLCEAAWHHPDLEVSYNKVTVKLKSHDVDAITDRDFELAKKVEDVICWAPTRETGALTGPPKSQRILADPA